MRDPGESDLMLACATLANRVFGTLPGVEWACATLANTGFCGLTGVRCDG
ncbi:hypothetical protein [uncultured Murdochiella sp.]|nr:hypothetical protein [uncultured Murdochiella sp.]